jgi:hypothetical protein
MDWLYTLEQAQSSAVESREALLEILGGLDLPDPLIAPDTARGFFLEPELIERLDLGMDNGVHDRRRYLPGNPGGWLEQVLVP